MPTVDRQRRMLASIHLGTVRFSALNGKAAEGSGRKTSEVGSGFLSLDPFSGAGKSCGLPGERW